MRDAHEVGEDDDLAKEARVLNRIVRWHSRQGITYEADPRHSEVISRDAGTEKLNTIERDEETEQRGEELIKI